MQEDDRELIGSKVARFMAAARARRHSFGQLIRTEHRQRCLAGGVDDLNLVQTNIPARDVRDREFVDDVALAIRARNHMRRSDDLRDERSDP